MPKEKLKTKTKIEFKPGITIGNRKLISLHHKNGEFERWKCECTHCGRILYLNRESILKGKRHTRCNYCRVNNCPEFQTFQGGWGNGKDL